MTKQADEHLWHLGSDGSVIESWPDDDKPGQLQYCRIRTTRKVDLSDLRRLDERIDQFHKRSDRMTAVSLTIAAVLGVFLVIGFILMMLGALPDTWLILWILLLLPVAFFVMIGPGLIHGPIRKRLDDLYGEAGLVPPAEGHSLREKQALELIEISESPLDKRKQ